MQNTDNQPTHSLSLVILGNQVYTTMVVKDAMRKIETDANFIAYRDTLKRGAVLTHVDALRYHEPLGDGDAHFVDAIEQDGSMLRIFKPDFLYFTKASVIARV